MKQMGLIKKVIVYGYNYNLEYVNKNENSIIDETEKVLGSIPIVKTEYFGHIYSNCIIPIGSNLMIDSINKIIKIEKNFLD